MSARTRDTRKQFGALVWIIVFFSASLASIASLRKFPNGGSRIIQQARQNNHNRNSRILGNNDITILLDDLDNQTEAIKNGQEIGDELLDGNTKKLSKDKKVALSGKNSVVMKKKGTVASNEEKLTDDSSQAISIPEAPTLIDVKGIPDKATAVESGASYLTGKPFLVLNRESNTQDVNKWFLYYPLSKESDMQMP
ncbi:PREDICTED: uncharacterized protein LOC107338373 [Acropora digitifera]|uniref:uncharacterized protein LOC107338373 n=1 Tax=Acropora digitifera TaxID=70779 RepID=UPI00077B0647|nr:PREDICTED: uncharacterized protein LOC107338373 [Acropora digitifera]